MYDTLIRWSFEFRWSWKYSKKLCLSLAQSGLRTGVGSRKAMSRIGWLLNVSKWQMCDCFWCAVCVVRQSQFWMQVFGQLVRVRQERSCGYKWSSRYLIRCINYSSGRRPLEFEKIYARLNISNQSHWTLGMAVFNQWKWWFPELEYKWTCRCWKNDEINPSHLMISD